MLSARKRRVAHESEKSDTDEEDNVEIDAEDDQQATGSQEEELEEEDDEEIEQQDDGALARQFEAEVSSHSRDCQLDRLVLIRKLASIVGSRSGER